MGENIRRRVYLFQIQNLIAEKIFLPLAIGYIWSYASTKENLMNSYSLEGVFFQRRDVDEYLKEIENPDVVGFSTYVWNWEFSKEMAKAIKERWPDCLIIMGGPQVSYKVGFHQELPFVDLVATYGGEEQFAEVLEQRLLESPNYDSIVGLITHNTERLQKRKQVADVNIFPSPYLTGFFDKIIENNPAVPFNMIIETNRGCPYTCAFCNMFDEYYVKLRQFDLKTIKSEIDWGIRKSIDYLDCADSNFGIFARDIEITQYIVDKKKTYGIPRMFNYTSAKNQPKHVQEIQRLLGSVGIDRGISVSLQSLNPSTLEVIKRWNLDEERLAETIETYKKQGLESFIELILGLPLETKESWIAGLNKLIDYGIECSLLIHPLSVVPNTPFDDPDFVKKYDLEFAVTRSPAQGFCYGHESPQEREKICIKSNTMTVQDWIDSYVYGKCIVGVHYFHGLSFYVAKFLRKYYGIPTSQFLTKLFEQYLRGDGFFGEEYKRICDALRKSFYELKPWGRKILGDQDMYWSDQAASAMYLINHLEEHLEALKKFIKVEFPQVDSFLVEESIRFNRAILEKPNVKFPLREKFTHDWLGYLVEDQDSFLAIESELEFRGRSWENEHDHAIHVYWFGRKSSRCFIKDIRKIEDV